jgi:hypothetical protein
MVIFGGFADDSVHLICLIDHNQIRSANLLGVAGVDVPIKEVVRHAPAYRVRTTDNCNCNADLIDLNLCVMFESTISSA